MQINVFSHKLGSYRRSTHLHRKQVRLTYACKAVFHRWLPFAIFVFQQHLWVVVRLIVKLDQYLEMWWKAGPFPIVRVYIHFKSMVTVVGLALIDDHTTAGHNLKDQLII